MSKATPITELLRRAIKESGQTEYGIWKATGVHQSQINRFVNENQGLSFETAAKLADYLGLTLKSK